ncbi:MAG: hypothetical protein ACI9UA_005320 [Pseudoalteromonas tetraodonis]|jgi:hypothetical protein
MSFDFEIEATSDRLLAPKTYSFALKNGLNSVAERR